MSRRTAVALAIVGLLLIGAATAVVLFLRRGFSARDEPSAVEVFVARRMRHLAVPSHAREMQNPLALTPEVLDEARAHFADHCALCHGNDGKGETPLGQNMYPKAPDMTSSPTQSLSDGELFYIIENGVRLTGMPAWGDGGHEAQGNSWQLVHFIRHLPEITPEEIQGMQALNPKTREEFEQEEEERRFLAGEEDGPRPKSSTQGHKH